MEYHLLREKTDGSGQYEPTGEVLRGTLEDAVNEAVRRTQRGAGRTAIYPFESLNQRPVTQFDQENARLAEEQQQVEQKSQSDAEQEKPE